MLKQSESVLFLNVYIFVCVGAQLNLINFSPLWGKVEKAVGMHCQKPTHLQEVAGTQGMYHQCWCDTVPQVD